MDALAILNPAAHAAITQDLASGSLQVGELLNSPKKGEADADTIGVTLSDNPTAVQIAARLEHEQIHRENDMPGGPYENESLACSEARAYAQTFATLRTGSCMDPSEGFGGVSCANLSRIYTMAFGHFENCGSLDWYSMLGLYDTGCCTTGD